MTMRRTLPQLLGRAALPWRWLGAALLGLLAAASVAVVPDSRQAVVLRLGAPVRVINAFTAGSTGSGGLVLHWPLIEALSTADRRVQQLPAARIALRTADDQDLSITAQIVWRVTNPQAMVAAAGSEQALAAQLSAQLPALLQAEAQRLALGGLLAPGGAGAFERVRAALDGRARGAGAQVIAVTLVRSELQRATLATTLAAMAAEQARAASAIQASGAAAAQQVTADGEARAAALIAASAGADPEFYDFYRALRSYEATLTNPANKGRTTIVLGPGSQYLRQFDGRIPPRP